jgi:tetratricopeptide (TPR) repeat protein
VARQTALGLQHAHMRGLVHRDIKPANLLLSHEGAVKIVDLGIARLIFPDIDDPGTVKLTRTGELMGTPDYLSPEQIHDFHRVDIRADIYSLGCTMFQLLAGEPPFTGRSLAEKVLVQRRGDAPDITTRRSDLPPGLAAVIQTMMAMRPERRFQTPADVVAALDPFVRTVDAASLASPRPPRLESGRAREQSDSLCPPEQDETWAPRGGCETWAPRGGFASPKVSPEAHRPAPRATPIQRPPTLSQAPRLDNHRVLLAGTLLIALIGLLTWGFSASRGTGQATSVVSASERRKPGSSRPVRESIVENTHRASPRSASDQVVVKSRVVRSGSESAQSYLARARSRLKARDFASVIADTGEALRLDPRLAEAYTLRATACNNLSRLDQAIDDATQALRLDPSSSEARTQRALAYNNVGKHDEAVADSTEALRLDPKSVLAYTQRAWVYLHRGDPDRAIADYDEALRLDPKLAWVFEHRARAYIMKGEPEHVIADCTEAVRIDPKLAFAFFERGDAYVQLRDLSHALADADEAIRLEPQLAGAHRLRGDICTKEGEFDRAITSYNEAIRLDPRSVASYRGRAEAYSRKGQPDRADVDRREAERLKSSAAR